MASASATASVTDAQKQNSSNVAATITSAKKQFGLFGLMNYKVILEATVIKDVHTAHTRTNAFSKYIYNAD